MPLLSKARESGCVISARKEKKLARKELPKAEKGSKQAAGRQTADHAKQMPRKRESPKKGEELLLRLLLLRGKRLKGRREELVPEGNKKASKRRLERPKGLRRSGGIFCACQDRQEP